MKKLLFIIPVLLLLLYVTNPTKAEFKEYIKENYQEIVHSKSNNEGDIVQLFNNFIHSLNNGSLVKIERKNCYFFSLYGMAAPELGETNVSQYIGVFRLFIRIS